MTIIRVVDLDLTVFAFISNYLSSSNEGDGLPLFPAAVATIKTWLSKGDTVLFCSRSKRINVCRRALAGAGIDLDDHPHVIHHTPNGSKSMHFALIRSLMPLDNAHLYDDDTSILSEARQFFPVENIHVVNPDSGLGYRGVDTEPLALPSLQIIANRHGYALSAYDADMISFSKL